MTPDGSYRFRPSFRLRDAASYGRVFKKARRSRDKWFTVLYRPKRQGDARLGLAISRKACRLASNRNRIKRIVRESFRHNRRSIRSMDVVVLNQPAAANASNEQLFSSLAGHWQTIEKAITRPDNEKSHNKKLDNESDG